MRGYLLGPKNPPSRCLKVSERVAILDAIDKKSLGDNQHNGSEKIPTLSQAAQKAGFGNEKTARQATKVVHEGAPELIEAGNDSFYKI
ncbi:hypothetical protein A3193_18570 [Candidatus Thiodiazotropha endoloripes]|nr:hypothetical protein A3193_18570 [Candidatus Thiodiazotropha endoloripes]